MSTEFVIEQSQRNVVEEYWGRIEELFNVEISFANGTAGKLWVTLKGEKIEKAKSYIQALALPEQTKEIFIPTSLVKTIGRRSQEHFKLESEYGVVIDFPQDTKALISGSMMDVTMAASYLEEFIKKLSKSAQPKPNRALADFALKLGYEQKQIDNVFEKLGPTIDQNTFLKELINVSGAKAKLLDQGPSQIPMRTVTTSQTDQPETYNVRHGYSGQDMIVARGMVPRTSGSTVQNRDFGAVGSSNPYRDLGMLARDEVSRGSIPRGTRPSSSLQTYPNNDWQDNIGNVSNVTSRGLILPRTTAQTTQGNTATYSSTDRAMNGQYFPLGNDYNPAMYSKPPNAQVDQLVAQLLNSKNQQMPQSDLRHIVIDGSNVAMSHGNNKVFSCKGIALCVNWFRQRGHNQITVFVPTWRKESPKIDNPITDQHILNQLEAQGYLTFTPSRRVKGRRIVCYDDRFIIKLADSTDGVIVSNDNFKDLASENPQWREVIEQRLLMYSFVNDMFMPPDDPLGRHGPTLDEFLHKGTPTHRRLCPYGRRCTYGARCKYHHPEREDLRMPIYQNLKVLFPNQDALIATVMRKYPQEKDADKLASHILNMMH